MGSLQTLAGALSRKGKSTVPRHRRARKSKRSTGRCLRVENLERREVMTTTWGLAGGILTINADPAGSQVVIQDYNPANVRGMPDLLGVQATSNDGSWHVMLPKQAVTGISFNGSSRRDVFVANTGLTPYNFPLSQTVRGWSGDDYIVTGMGNDTIYGFYGNDTIKSGGGRDTIDGGSGDDVIYGGSGNDVIKGGWGRDRIWGENGDDRIDGESGYDDLYGGKGDDWLFGGYDPDWIEGNEGNDHLFGQSGNDLLYGGSGQDGLYGGYGADQLHGGPDSDRFLVLTNESSTDRLLDDGVEDIRVSFTNEAARTVTWPSGYFPSTTTYAAGTWSDRDIEWVDQALGTIAVATGNNALLYRADGAEPTLYRLGDASNSYIAFNDSVGDTHYSNQSFEDSTGTASEASTYEVVFHEFGHNWDTREEASNILGVYGEAIVQIFRDASDWTQSLSDTSGYTQSGDKKWWYESGTNFVSSYARTNPKEDFAESFSAYFMDELGEPFREGTGGAASAPDKMTAIGYLITYAGYLGADGRPIGAESGDPSPSYDATVSLPTANNCSVAFVETPLAITDMYQRSDSAPQSESPRSANSTQAAGGVLAESKVPEGVRASHDTYFARYAQRAHRTDSSPMTPALQDAADELWADLYVV